MGHRTTISGHIQEAWYVIGTGGNEDPQLKRIREMNDAAIASLSELPGSSHLSSEIFGSCRYDTKNTYRGRVFHLGTSINSLWDLDSDAAEWLNEFESLLRKMCWESAELLVSTEYMGHYHYLWGVSKESAERFGENPPVPAESWSFRQDEINSLTSSSPDAQPKT